MLETTIKLEQKLLMLYLDIYGSNILAIINQDKTENQAKFKLQYK